MVGKRNEDKDKQCPECYAEVFFDSVFECWYCGHCGWSDFGDTGEEFVPALA